MKIVHVASELAPIAKVGGLADAVYGLCRALLEKKQRVEVILPKYDLIDFEHVDHLKVTQDILSFFDGKERVNTIWSGFVDKIPITFIEPKDPPNLFNRKTIYGCEDDVLRFAYFCRAALHYLVKSKKHPDIIHLHDWHTALISPLLSIFSSEGLSARSVFTIHNLAYQGNCDAKILKMIGLDSPTIRELKDQGTSTYNPLKGGIVFSNQVTTVSPTYAKEILSKELGKDLQPTLLKYQTKLTGILNGIDFNYWNPETDPLLPSHYSAKQLTETPPFLQKKAQVKTALRKRLRLAEKSCPIVSCIARLVQQKGPELIKAAILRTLEGGGQFVLLAAPCDDKILTQFSNLKQKLSGSPHVHLELHQSEELAHLIYAGSDLFLAPSLFEPCGLTPLIAMHYGTVALVHQTGGLKDTVFEGKNGFSFESPTVAAIHEAIDRALLCWKQNPKLWHRLMERGMQEDYSWKKPAEAYLNVYRKAIEYSDLYQSREETS